MSQQKSQKRGFAWGAMFALVASLFGVTPAQAAATDGANILVSPSAGTTFTGLVHSEFDLAVQLAPGQSNSNFNDDLKFKITVTSGHNMTLLYMASQGAPTLSDVVGPTSGSVQALTAGTTPTSVSFAASASGGLSYLSVKAYSTSEELTEWESMTMTITAWIDEIQVGNGVTSGTGVIDADEWRTTKTLTLYNMSDMPKTNNFTAPAAADVWATASVTIGALNTENLSGKFYLSATASPAALFLVTDAAGTNAVTSSPLTGEAVAGLGKLITSSWAINQISESQTISYQLKYVKSGDGSHSVLMSSPLGTPGTFYNASAPGVTRLTISAVVGDNTSGSGTAYTVRPNQTYTIKVHAGTGSDSVSTAVSMTLGGTALVTSSKLLSINGGSFVTAYPAVYSVTTGTDGYVSFTLATSGFVENDTLTIDAAVGNIGADAITLTVKNPTYVLDATSTLLATAPGTSVNVPFTVTDQWGVASSATNHYVKVTRGGTGFNYSTTVSYQAVASGAGSFAFTPEGATATGSATLKMEIVKLENGAYISVGKEDHVTVTVTGATNAFSTGLATSFSSSVSYFPSTVSWTTVTGKVTVTGSAVTITGDSSLIFRKSAAVPATTAGTITVASDASADYSFQVASLHVGSHTMTLVNGAASTTSLLIIDAVASDYGSAITWDTTDIVAGRTKVIIGTLKDANGNVVDTTNVGSGAGDSGTASITVTYTGTAGIVVGSMPTETDADGQFRLSVLTSAADRGSMVITATYLAQGAATEAKNKITSVGNVTIGLASTDAGTSDTKVNAGSFKGYVAVYAKGYEGKKLSAKIGNDWVVVESLASNFERVVDFTGAGYTIAVRIYIDRVLVDTITVTTK